MMLGFLHTASVHVETFENLVAERAPAQRSVQVVAESLLSEARVLGPDHQQVVAGLGFRLGELTTAGATVVVCTCSTLGAAAEALGQRIGVPVLRVDRAMAEQSVAGGGPVAIVAALESTLEPTRLLVDDAADRRSVACSTHLVEGAWDLFSDGNIDGYHRAIAEALPAISTTCSVIVLAQASMAGAVELVDLDTPVLSSPGLGVDAALRLLAALPKDPET